MHSVTPHDVFVALTGLGLALHLCVSGSAALPKAHGLLLRSQLFLRGVAAQLWWACTCSTAKSTAYEDAVWQSMLLCRKQVWGSICHVMAMIDMLLCVSSVHESTSVLPSEQARFIILARWAVALFGARFHSRLGDRVPIGCYVVIMVVNCVLSLMEVHPLYVNSSLGPASIAVLSFVAVPCNAAVVLSFLVRAVFLDQDAGKGWFAHRCWVIGGIAVSSCVARETVLARVKHKVEMSLSSAEATAVRAALYSVCDAVVELDKDLLVSRRSDKLAALLVRTSGNLEGTPFSDLIMRDKDKVAFEDAARSEAEGAEVVVSRMALRDSIGNPVEMEVWRVPFKHFSKTRHLVGMWESGRKRAAEGEMMPARDDVVQLPIEPQLPSSGTNSEFSFGSSEDSRSSQRLRKRSRSRKRLALGIDQALAHDVFAIEGLVVVFDCTFKILSYVWPDSRRVPGCGDKVVDFLAGGDGMNNAYFEAHNDCCTELVNAALAVATDTSDTIRLEFESTWMLHSRQWSDKTIRAKARMNISARTTSGAMQSERPAWAKSNIVMEATVADVLLFKLKPTAQSL